jgi:membrane fusion protein, multidrug efflux system
MNAPMKKNAEADATPVVAPSPAVAAAPAPAAPVEAPKKKSRVRRNVLMFGLPLVLAVGGGYFYLNGGRYVDTDNAYVQQVKVSLSADVAGRVTEVDVAENQQVTAGAVLFKIDPEPYRIALAQADAALASARVNVEQLRVAYSTAQAKLTSAQQTLELRQSEYDRQKALVDQGTSAKASLDDVNLSLQTANSSVLLAEQELAGSVAALAGDPQIAVDAHPAVLTALAARDVAARNLEKTTVLAPADGVVSQMASLNVGQFVATGTTIASIIRSDNTWIEANFKETQLDGLKSGLPVEVSVDAYPGVSLHGTVDSIGAATGSQFALIPAQNATGNWVKVTQRITVRVKLDDRENEALLRAGMSAVVAVDTGATVLDKLMASRG